MRSFLSLTRNATRASLAMLLDLPTAGLRKF
jgi:hypothetical protein